MTPLRALVCDDEAPLRDLMARRVEKLGLKVDKASDGKEGLTLIGANRYDLIVTDIYMPEVTGLELLEAAKAQDREIQVVIVTATATVENAIEAINLGAFCYLTKPFDHLSVFDNAVLRAQELRQLTLHKRQAAAQPGNGSSPEPSRSAAPANGEVKELEELRQLMAVLPIGLVVVGAGGRVSLSTPLAKSWLEQEVKSGRRAIHRFLEHASDQEGEVEEEVKLGQKVLHLSTAAAPGGDPRSRVVILEEKRNGTSPQKTDPGELVEASANLREGLLQLARLNLGEEALGIIRAMALEVADLERQAGVRSPLGKVASAPPPKARPSGPAPLEQKTRPAAPRAQPAPPPPLVDEVEPAAPRYDDEAEAEAAPIAEPEPSSPFESTDEDRQEEEAEILEPAAAAEPTAARPYTTGMLQKGAAMFAEGGPRSGGLREKEPAQDVPRDDEVQRQAFEAVRGFIARVAEEEDFEAPPLEPSDLDDEEVDDRDLNKETLARLGAVSTGRDPAPRDEGLD